MVDEEGILSFETMKRRILADKRHPMHKDVVEGMKESERRNAEKCDLCGRRYDEHDLRGFTYIHRVGGGIKYKVGCECLEKLIGEKIGGKKDIRDIVDDSEYYDLEFNEELHENVRYYICCLRCGYIPKSKIDHNTRYFDLHCKCGSPAQWIPFSETDIREQKEQWNDEMDYYKNLTFEDKRKYDKPKQIRHIE